MPVSSSIPSELIQIPASGEPISAMRKRWYWFIAITLVVWTTAYIYAVTELIPNGIYWLSYYAMNYDAGFVRRGLAGAIVAWFPKDQYFIVTMGLLVGAVAVYLCALLALMTHVLRGGKRTERRVIVALFVPVLPCTFTFALLGPRPELAAAGALVVFGLALTRVHSMRGTVVCSAGFGLFIALAAFVHEGIPLEFALGAVLAIAVLAPVEQARTRRTCMAVAVGPGLLATAAISVLGRRDVADVTCRGIPHAMMRNTFKVPPEKFGDYMAGRFQSVSDYHDWVCANVLPAFDQNLVGGMQSVRSLGVPTLVGGFTHGLLVCIGTVLVMAYATKVSLKAFVPSIRGGLLVPAAALALMIPVFATGVDWIRWWMLITINIVCVFLLWASGRPEGT